MLLFVADLRVRKSDFRYHAAKVWIRVIELPDQIDYLLIIEAEPREIFVGLDAISEPVDDPIKKLANAEHEEAIPAGILHSDHDGNALFPLLDQLLQHFGRILQIRH